VAVSYGMSGTSYVQGQQKIPTEVSSTAIQYRTFTVDEEDISKNTVGPDGKPIPGQFSIIDLDTGEYVGYIGNYWRFPTFPSPANSGVQVPPDAGIPSRSGFGFGGNEPLGPYLTLYDSNFNTPSLSVVGGTMTVTNGYLLPPTLPMVGLSFQPMLLGMTFWTKQITLIHR